MPHLLRKTVKFTTRKLLVHIPVLSCGHQARFVRGKGKIRAAYRCYVCERKQAREDRDYAQIDRFIIKEKV